jgi:lysine 2,3-aminomutase
MAGQKDGVFQEKLSPFLREKYETAKAEKDADVIKMIEKQYVFDARESIVRDSEKRRHYEAEIHRTFENKPLKGVEKLYKRTILIEPTTICSAHCRWCLRGRYEILHLSEEELTTVARYCGKARENKDVREVLITGGDPLMVPDRLDFLFDQLMKYAPQIRIYRVGSRVPMHDPSRIDRKMLGILKPRNDVRIEMGIQVNHYAELFPEVEESLRKLREAGVVLYDQSVLLKDLNDDFETLVELFDRLRYLGVETHYLFHCIPLKGMDHHRTSVDRGIQLIRELTSSGRASGRCKPMYTLLTDIGKVTLYEGTILKRNRNKILLQTYYCYKDRVRWNPSWELPDSAVVDEDGFIRVWYLDHLD